MAHINEHTIVFWNGQQIVWAWLRGDDNCMIAAEFELDQEYWEELCGDVAAWLEAPRYSVRSDLRAWFKDSRIM